MDEAEEAVTWQKGYEAGYKDGRGTGRGLLARLEWAGDTGDALCPACQGEPTMGGHELGCWLAAELRPTVTR
jgi:hypothetical protein